MPAAPSSTAHPFGLYVLFGTEAWERFSYYGMRALLTLYLLNQLKLEEGDALAIYGLYTGLVYLTPLIGGYIADTYLGARKAIVTGGFLMMAGQFALMVPSLFYLGMTLLIVGNGFFKPNVSTIVGSIYPQGDARRDGGFTIFYMGINLGALFSPLVCSTLGETYGWAYGFGSAGVGMAIGLAIFVAAQTYIITVPQGTLPDEVAPAPGIPPAAPEESTMPILAEREKGPFGRGADDDDENDPTVVYSKDQLRDLEVGLLDEDPSDVCDTRGKPETTVDVVAAVPARPKEPSPTYVRGRNFTFADWQHIAVAAIAASGLAGLLAVAWEAKGQTGVLGAGALIIAALVGLETLLSRKRSGKRDANTPVAPPLTAEDWHRTGVILLLAVFTIFFWMGFEQAGGTFAIFADERTNRVLGGFTIPAGWFQSINPLMIFVLAPVFSMIWSALARTRFNPSTPQKMAVGLVFLGAGFGIMGVADQVAGESGMVGPLWLASAFLLHTLGELCLSPIGLSMVTKLAPLKLASLLMGVWFLASAGANYLAGVLPAIMDATQVPLYWFLLGLSLAAGALLFAISPLISRYMYGRG